MVCDDKIFYLNAAQYFEILKHIDQCLPEEACGLIGGKCNTSEIILPMKNILSSRYAYKMDAIDLIHAFKKFEQQNLDLIGIYHSHPTGPCIPSMKDIIEFSYPGVVSLVIVPGKKPQIRGFNIYSKEYIEVKIILN